MAGGMLRVKKRLYAPVTDTDEKRPSARDSIAGTVPFGTLRFAGSINDTKQEAAVDEPVAKRRRCEPVLFELGTSLPPAGSFAPRVPMPMSSSALVRSALADYAARAPVADRAMAEFNRALAAEQAEVEAEQEAIADTEELPRGGNENEDDYDDADVATKEELEAEQTVDNNNPDKANHEIRAIQLAEAKAAADEVDDGVEPLAAGSAAATASTPLSRALADLDRKQTLDPTLASASVPDVRSGQDEPSADSVNESKVFGKRERLPKKLPTKSRLLVCFDPSVRRAELFECLRRLTSVASDKRIMSSLPDKGLSIQLRIDSIKTQLRETDQPTNNSGGGGGGGGASR